MRTLRWLTRGRLALALLLTTPAGQALARLPAWPQAHSDLRANPEVVFGVLPNGLRYAIRRNLTPPGQVSLHMAVEVGSANETHDQEGLAHLIEHMAFRGSTHVADGEVTRTLERLGLRTGADANASTTKETTFYRFDLAKPDARSFDTSLGLMREIAGNLTLSPAALDTERKVVLSEIVLRDTPEDKAAEAQAAAQFGSHPYVRSPGGRPDVVAKATPAQLRALYDAYYRPERTVLVVVGDVDPAVVEKKIKATFSDWRGRGKPGRDPAPPTLSHRGETLTTLTVPTHVSSLVMSWIQPARLPDESRAGHLRDEVEFIGRLAFQQRIIALSEAAGKPSQVSDGLGAWNTAHVARGVTLDALWVNDPAKTLEVLAKAQRQLVRFGLSQGEVDWAVALRRKALTDAANGSFGLPTNRSSFVAGGLVGGALSGRIALSERQQLDLFEEAARGLTAARVTKVLRSRFTGDGPVIVYTSGQPPPGGDTAMRGALVAARAAPLTPYVVPPVLAWNHADFGPPGAVAERREIADLGVTMVRFANGVRLTIKPTSFSPHRFGAVVMLGHGLLDQPRYHVDASDLSVALLNMGGLNDLTRDQWLRAQWGKGVAISAGERDDAFEIGNGPWAVRTTDLDLDLQSFAALVTAPAWRADEWKATLAGADEFELAATKTAQGVFLNDAPALLHSGDARWRHDTAAMRRSWTPEQAKAFLKPILDTSPIEVVIVGDITPEAAIAAVAKTFGGLPPRPDRPDPPGLRDVRIHAPTPTPLVLRHDGPADQAIAEVSWPATDRFSAGRRYAAALALADIMRVRITDKLRTEQGKTYSPRGTADFSETLPGWGRISLAVDVAPSQIDNAYKVIDGVTADLATHEVSADELARVVTPAVEAEQRNQVLNGYWLHWLSGARADPRRLDVIRHALPDAQAVTPADVLAAARTWLVRDRQIRIVVTPREATTASSPSARTTQSE